ncbi:hypothetical protein [Streptomyces sp. AC555_RSS877]|uniref:hypothetical protein n=1 Tax=Streptomyces sp. AC555_RSS877 TaxID=2823688 RepID=UPI001C267BF5|nr:hypothetical protein [Streptomyces sp. AC555_RSS877]
MRSTHRARTLLIAAAVVAGACALTACEEDDANSKAGTTSATAATDAGTSTGEGSVSTTRGAGDSADSGSAGDGAGTSADDDSAADDSAAGVDKGVSGTFAGGTIEYLAPQKYTVSVNGKQQQFYVSNSTAVYGAGVLCGEYDPKATTRCSLADLESNTKSGSVAANVVVKSGVATRITERAAPDEGPAVDDQ